MATHGRTAQWGSRSPLRGSVPCALSPAYSSQGWFASIKKKERPSGRVCLLAGANPRGPAPNHGTQAFVRTSHSVRRSP